MDISSPPYAPHVPPPRDQLNLLDLITLITAGEEYKWRSSPLQEDHTRHTSRILVRKTQGKEHMADTEVDGGDDTG